jgi:hypothetical protein
MFCRKRTYGKRLHWFTYTTPHQSLKGPWKPHTRVDQPVAKASTYTGQHNIERQAPMP